MDQVLKNVLLDTFSYEATNAILDEAQGKSYRANLSKTGLFVIPDTIWNSFLKERMSGFVMVNGPKTTERFNQWLYLVMTVGYLNLAFLGQPFTETLIDVSVSQMAALFILDNLL